MGFHFNASSGKINLRSKEAREIASQRMLETLRGAKLGKAGKLFTAASIERHKADLFTGKTRDTAAREHTHREIHSNGARMKQVKRPNVHGAAGKINTAGCVSDDGLFSGWRERRFLAGVWQSSIP